MKQTVNFFQFCDSFSDTYKNNFSYEGKRALFDYLEQYEEETGEEIELDTVALCCEYSEYESAKEAAEQYNGAVEDNKDFNEEDRERASLAWLEDQTTVIPVDGGGVIIQDF